MIGFLVGDRVRIKIRIRVGVTFNVSIYHWSNCRRSKCRTFDSMHRPLLPAVLEQVGLYDELTPSGPVLTLLKLGSTENSVQQYKQNQYLYNSPPTGVGPHDWFYCLVVVLVGSFLVGNYPRDRGRGGQCAVDVRRHTP